MQVFFFFCILWFFTRLEWTKNRLYTNKKSWMVELCHEWGKHIALCNHTEHSSCFKKNYAYSFRNIERLVHLFFKPIKRGANGKFSQPDKDFVAKVFKIIVESIKWEKLVFLNLWDLKFQKPLNDEQTMALDKFLKHVIKDTSKIRNLAVLHKH